MVKRTQGAVFWATLLATQCFTHGPDRLQWKIGERENSQLPSQPNDFNLTIDSTSGGGVYHAQWTRTSTWLSVDVRLVTGSRRARDGLRVLTNGQTPISKTDKKETNKGRSFLEHLLSFSFGAVRGTWPIRSRFKSWAEDYTCQETNIERILTLSEPRWLGPAGGPGGEACGGHWKQVLWTFLATWCWSTPLHCSELHFFSFAK